MNIRPTGLAVRSTLVLAFAALVLAGCGTDDPGASRESATPSAGPSSEAPSSPPTAEPETTPTPTAEPETDADGAVLLNARLPEGPAAAVAYTEAGTSLRLPDGSVREVAHDYNGFAITGDLLVGGWYDEQRGRDYVDVERGGEQLTTRRMGQGVAQSASGRTIAWNAPDGTLMTAWDGGQVAISKAERGNTVTAVTGDGTCFEANSPQGGCSVYYVPQSGPARRASSHGIDDTVFLDVLHVADATADGVLAVATEFRDEGSCWAVQRDDRAKRRWETCDHTLLSFAPGGAHLLATTAYLDGFGFANIEILDAATGKETATFRVPDGHIANWTWESPTSAVLVIHQQGWRMVRITTTGGAETIATWDGEERDELERPWTLAMRP